MKKVLVTGCAGFIGFHISEKLLKQSVEVIGIDNLSRSGSENNLSILDTYENFKFFKADIRNFEEISKIFQQYIGIDLIIHQAAQVAVTTSITDPRLDFDTNALGTFNLLEATRLFSPDSVFQFASTNKVYGTMEELEVIEVDGKYNYKKLKKGVNEEFNLDLHSPYGCSKGVADQYVRDYNRIYGLKTMVLRQSCIYGTRQFGVEDQGWVAWFAIASILGKKTTIYGDGKQARDLLWIDDLVDAYIALYEKSDLASGQIFNLGGGSENILSLNELVDYLSKDNLMKINPQFSSWRPGDQKIYVSDIKKINELTGWKPKTSTKEGIKLLIDWCKKNGNLLGDVLNK